MNIRLIYATNSGGSQEAGKIISDVLTSAGHVVTLKRANEASAEDLATPDVVILGSCTWERLDEKKQLLEGQLQEHMFAFAQSLAGKTFPQQRFAVYGLGDSSYTIFCGAADRLEELVASVQGQQVGPTLRVDGFFFHLDENQQKVRAWAEGLGKALKKA